MPINGVVLDALGQTLLQHLVTARLGLDSDAHPLRRGYLVSLLQAMGFFSFRNDFSHWLVPGFAKRYPSYLDTLCGFPPPFIAFFLLFSWLGWRPTPVEITGLFLSLSAGFAMSANRGRRHDSTL